MKTRSRSCWFIERKDHERKTLYIIDEDVGCSVTNDAENVCLDIVSIFPEFKDYRFIYRDTMSRWDELKHDKGRFVDFGVLSLEDLKYVPK